MPRPKIDPARLHDLLAAGRNGVEIAAELGVSHSCVTATCRRLGIVLPGTRNGLGSPRPAVAAYMRSPPGRRHTDRLHSAVWPRTCQTCGRPFVGTARQVYCRTRPCPTAK